jgi:hypothetical protein
MGLDTDKLWTCQLVHLKEDVKLHIISVGRLFLRGSWLFGAGVWEFSHRNVEIISTFLATDPGTDRLWPWGVLHIKEDVKLHILSGG